MASEIISRSRTSRAFLDTNVLVYSDDPRDPAKQAKALDLIKDYLRQGTGVVSLQVLQEYFVSARGKLKLDAELAKHILASIDIHRLHGFSFWDALVLRMAKQTGCRILLSEDMQHGQEFDGVKIVNPFL